MAGLPEASRPGPDMSKEHLLRLPFQARGPPRWMEAGRKFRGDNGTGPPSSHKKASASLSLLFRGSMFLTL